MNHDREWRQVGEDEFRTWIRAYPRPLEASAVTVGEPAVMAFNDWMLGVWPESVVASYFIDGGYDQSRKGPWNWSVLKEVPKIQNQEKTMTLAEIENAETVNMTRQEARDLVDAIDHEELINALDLAQGEADERGKTSFIVIRIAGAPL
jgi:hypothetical protein